MCLFSYLHKNEGTYSYFHWGLIIIYTSLSLLYLGNCLFRSHFSRPQLQWAGSLVSVDLSTYFSISPMPYQRRFWANNNRNWKWLLWPFVRQSLFADESNLEMDLINVWLVCARMFLCFENITSGLISQKEKRLRMSILGKRPLVTEYHNWCGYGCRFHSLNYIEKLITLFTLESMSCVYRQIFTIFTKWKLICWRSVNGKHSISFFSI